MARGIDNAREVVAVRCVLIICTRSIADLNNYSALKREAAPTPPGWKREAAPKPTPPGWKREAAPEPTPPGWKREAAPEPTPPDWRRKRAPAPAPGR
jgi:hypothetical protein